MKKLLFSVALFTAITSLVFAQQKEETDLTKVLNGEWIWLSYEGGTDNVACTEAPGHYKLELIHMKGAPGLFYSCRAFKDNVYHSSAEMLVTEDASNPAFPYKLHFDITAPLFNGAAMPSVNFRVVGDKFIEFSNGSKADFRYLFQNIGNAEGC